MKIQRGKQKPFKYSLEVKDLYQIISEALEIYWCKRHAGKNEQLCKPVNMSKIIRKPDAWEDCKLMPGFIKINKLIQMCEIKLIESNVIGNR